MATTRKKIINFGASVVTYAEFTLQDETVILESIFNERLDYDLSSTEGWMDATKAAVKKLIHRHKLSGQVDLIFPGYQLLTKNLKVPHVEESKRPQIIAFNAQSNIPYTLSEVSWDSQVVGDDGIESEVLFIAVKKEILEGFCREISNLGLKPVSVDAASILDYNAYRYAYSENTGDTLIINIGAKSSNLMFIGPEGFFIRNIALGGNVLTQSIADAMGKPFDETEDLKIEYFTQDEAHREANEIIDGKVGDFNRRMGQEITRSIISYRQQKKGKSPGLILLAGGGSQLAGLAEYLLENQKVKVEYFNPSEAVTVGSKVDEAEFETVVYRFGEILGKAVKDLSPEAIGINLLPQEIRRNIEFGRKKPYILLAAAALALAPALAFFQTRGGDGDFVSSIASLQAEVPRLNALNRQINEKMEAAESLRADIRQFENLVNSKNNWILFFTELQESLFDVRDVWLDEIRVERAGGEGSPRGGSAARPVTERPLTLVLKGRLLLRDGAQAADGVDERVLERRIRALQERFEASEFIKETTSILIDFAAFQEGTNLLPFEFIMAPNPEKRL